MRVCLPSGAVTTHHRITGERAELPLVKRLRSQALRCTVSPGR